MKMNILRGLKRNQQQFKTIGKAGK